MSEETETMTNVIVDSAGIAEEMDFEYCDDFADLTATKEATGKPMEFHVTMNGYTFEDMEEMIVQAAAQLIVGRHRGTDLAKKIQDVVLEQISMKINDALEKVTADIIDQPMRVGPGGKEIGTMREFIGLAGREFLDARVDRSGRPVDRGYGAWGKRIDWIVWQAMSDTFKREIEKATSATVSEAQGAIRKKHEALLAEEKARLRAALDKATS